MNTLLIIIIIIPITIATISKIIFKYTISWNEFFIQLFLTIILSLTVWGVGGAINSYNDIEIINGKVTEKKIHKESCPLYWKSYPDDFCTNYITRFAYIGQSCVNLTDSKGRVTRICTPIYETQYKYIYSWEQKFEVFTNLDYVYTIPRVDSQGAIIPDRFKIIKINDPVSYTHSYQNWLKAASSNIFYEDGAVEEKYKSIIPEYPDKIYDIYKLDRVVVIGDINIPENMNEKLSRVNGILGKDKQVNIIIVLVDSNIAGEDFPYALRKAWYGFKKNDVVVFLGIKNNLITWNNVMSWSKNEWLYQTLHYLLNKESLKPINVDDLIVTIGASVKSEFERRSMKEFEYLKSQIPIPWWLTTICLIVSIGSSIIISIIFHKN